MDTARIQRGQLFGVFALLLGFALWSPTGKLDEFPKYWWDESFTIEMARTYNELGVFDLTVAPSTPSNIAIALNANGFPVSFPLAMLFRFTGVSVVVARLLMLGWMMMLFGVTYQFFKKYLGHNRTIAGLLLIASFASFYANGRTATGDIPGLFFFILALAGLSHEYFFATGFLTALALVTKTSSFHVAPIAIGLAIIAGYKRQSLRPLLAYSAGGLLVAFFWFWLLLPTFSWEALTPAINFFAYPTHKASLFLLALEHPKLIITQSLLLIVGLGAIVGIAIRKQPPFPKTITLALGGYCVLQTLVYLRSPGWSRYLLSVEYLLLLFLPYAFFVLQKLSSPYIKKAHPLMLSFIIAMVFSLHYQFASNIFPRKSRDDAVRTIMNELKQNPNAMIGFIDDPVIASLIPGNRKYQYIRIGGNTYAGKNPLDSSNNEFPLYLMGPSRNDAKALTYYTPLTQSSDVLLWKLRPSLRQEQSN